MTETATALLTSLDAGVLHVTWNRPDKKNALTGEMYDAFTAALTRAAADPAIRVVLVTGAGGHFTSGNDLADFAGWAGVSDPERLPVVRVIRAVVAFPKPLIAAVRGVCVGLGSTLLLNCDAVLASTNTTFAMPFTRLGLVPEFGSSVLFPALAGRVRASQILLSSESFGVAKAQELGMVSEVCEDDALDARATALARQLAEMPPATMRTVKAMLNPPDMKARLNAAIDEEMKLVMIGLHSPEHQEAVAAFREKRKPDFSSFT